MFKSNKYYPKYKIDPVSAQKQPYPSSHYYPYPEPKDTYGLNPMTLKSLKSLDIDDLQDAFGKGFQDQKSTLYGTKLENEKIFKEDPEINEIKSSIEKAKLNKVLAKQIHQNQLIRIQNLINDTKAEEKVLKDIELENEKMKQDEEKRRQDRLKAKYLIQQQMLEKEKIKQESIKEYEKDKKDIENLINNLRKEDLLAKEEENRKRNIARSYMENAYARKEERKFLEEKQKKEDEFNNKKAKIQFEKDQIFNKLCEQEAKRQAEKDYWENIRNELHLEQENKRLKLAELAEKEKKQRQKEEMIESALQHKKSKEENKKKELEMEEEFKKKYMEKLAEEEKLEKLNAQRRRQKELQWQDKLKQYQLQKEQQLKNLEKLKMEEEAKRYIIEQEKQRLIKENENLLKSYYPLGYQKAINSLRKINNVPNNEIKHDIIKNNIFGNTNPNKSSAYPKYGNIKNFVYDKSIQDVHHKINIVNYPMYNATANNNYDSYPTPEEYMKMMREVGQKNFAYAGNTDTTGIPMRGQLPIYHNRTMTRSISTAGGLTNNTNYSSNYSNIGNGNRRTMMKSSSTIYSHKNDLLPINKYRIENSNDIRVNNYGQNIQEKIPEPL